MVLGVLLAATILVWLPTLLLWGREADRAWELSVSFLDVGQGDAIFIETPDGVQALIDGGPDSAVLRELGRLMTLNDRTIDMVMATHPDMDHIGGLVDVLARYEVGHIVRTEAKNDTAAARAFDEAVLGEAAVAVFARAGQLWTLGASTTLFVWSPPTNTARWESNTASIVTQLRFGDIEFMLTGDAPRGIEDYLSRRYGNALASEVLKLAHHGSRTSTSEFFLDVVRPEYAIVSAGRNNRYGHPHETVVGRVVARDIALLNTAERGTVTFRTDGRRVWVVE
jgi:competence protein ComEC